MQPLRGKVEQELAVKLAGPSIGGVWKAGLCWPLDGSGAELPSRSEERVRYCFQFPSLVHYRFHPHSLPYAVLYLSG